MNSRIENKLIYIDMSHFLTLVIGDEPEKQLAKYDENLELPMHLYMTKEQLISEKRKEIEKYKKNYYDVFIQDKDAWNEEVKQLLASLSPDTLLTMYDCHI